MDPRQASLQPGISYSSPPPLPPPKSSAHGSGNATPLSGQYRPPPPPPPGYDEDSGVDGHGFGSNQHGGDQSFAALGGASGGLTVEDGWLPEVVRDKTNEKTELISSHGHAQHSTSDLQSILSEPQLQTSLLHDPTTSHPSLQNSTLPLHHLLSQNLELATSLRAQEQQLSHLRSQTQSRLLSLRALERQWRAKQAEQDAALREFSPPALYQKLGAAVSEQEALCRGLEESFLEASSSSSSAVTGGGASGWSSSTASEREVGDFVKRLREARKVAYLRRERKERWDEGRVGGWR